MKYISFTIGDVYGYQPNTERQRVHRDAINIQEFDSFELLQASDDYAAWDAEQNDGLNRDEQAWQGERDRLLRDVVVKYEGDFYALPFEAQVAMVGYKAAMDVDNLAVVNWKCEDGSTGLKKRVDLDKSEVELIICAVAAASNIIHTEADTQMPVDPWPLEITI